MLPSAAAFIDPLFSTGIPLTLLGIERLALTLGASKDAPLRSYAETTLAEAEHTARFVAGCYAAFPRFAAFTAYSMFYFAAASYAEMQRRLTPGRVSGGFLRAADSEFAGSLRELSPTVCVPGSDYLDRVAQALDRLNIAGLCDPGRKNWYPVDLEDTVRAAGKLGLSPEQAREALQDATCKLQTASSRAVIV
jgi:FADH2 O2-dependent halogenase